VKSPKLHFSIKSTAKSSPFSWFQLAIKQAPGSLRLQLHSCPMSLILFNLGHQEDPQEISSFSQVYPRNFLTWHIMAPKYIYIYISIHIYILYTYIYIYPIAKMVFQRPWQWSSIFTLGELLSYSSKIAIWRSRIRFEIRNLCFQQELKTPSQKMIRIFDGGCYRLISVINHQPFDSWGHVFEIKVRCFDTFWMTFRIALDLHMQSFKVSSLGMTKSGYLRSHPKNEQNGLHVGMSIDMSGTHKWV